MKKKLASLTAAFSLAVAGIMAPALPAQAQTVPLNGNVYGYGNTYGVQDPYVSQRDISTVANALGVQILYPGAGKGFTSGIIQRNGRHIGLEFDLNGNGTATVVSAYNLNDTYSRQQYNAAMQDAAQLHGAMSGRFNDYSRRVQPQYRPSVPEVVAGIGLLYILHEAINNNDRHHRDYRNHRDYRDHRYTPPRHQPPRHAPAPRPGHHRGHPHR
ncbi:MAG: hypothetical protein RBS08_05800 [Bdellovibrionales bacterium]|jgi:hypothetical protein|nr:hypothetical protein [Bdellovibrionales bacterium]